MTIVADGTVGICGIHGLKPYICPRSPGWSNIREFTDLLIPAKPHATPSGGRNSMTKHIRYLHYLLLRSEHVDHEMIDQFGETAIADALARLKFADMIESEPHVGGYHSGKLDVGFKVKLLSYGHEHLNDLRAEFEDAAGNLVPPEVTH
jgi:hypothetical protein